MGERGESVGSVGERGESEWERGKSESGGSERCEE